MAVGRQIDQGVGLLRLGGDDGNPGADGCDGADRAADLRDNTVNGAAHRRCLIEPRRSLADLLGLVGDAQVELPKAVAPLTVERQIAAL